MRRRRSAPEEHENHERWLVSYADFVTLLFAFFVVMYSVSSVNEGKFRVLSDTLVAAFKDPSRSLQPIQVGKLTRSPYNQDTSPLKLPNALAMSQGGSVGRDATRPATKGAKHESRDSGAAPGASKSGSGAGDPQAPDAGMAKLGAVATQVEAKMAPLIDKGLVKVRKGKHWLEVEFNTNLLFASGTARLSPEATRVLTSITGILKGFPNPIQVEGYTDNVPIRTTAYPSNWELSAARAASVVHLFMKAGIHPGRMVAIGYGEYRAIADNHTREGRRKNRRVVLVIPATSSARRILDLQRLDQLGASASATERHANRPRVPVVGPIRGGGKVRSAPG